jgi:hypothetical protein
VWPQARAGLIAIVIVFGLVEGCPLPPPHDTPAWERGFVELVRSAQHVVMKPVAWIGPLWRISQQWALYQAPGAQRYRLSIEGRAPDGTWSLLYRAGDPDHAEDAAVIESARVSGTWNPAEHPSMQYGAWCTWIALRMFDRHPEATAVRVRQEKIELVPGGYTPTGTYAFEVTRERLLR